MRRLSTEQMREMLNIPGVRLVDIRPADAYNGWRLDGEKRGGHVRGAKSLPFKWFRYLDWLEIVRNKELEPEHRLVLYGGSGEELERAAARFLRAGYESILIYERFHDEWCGDEALPLERLPRYRHLVPARWLDGLLRTGAADEYDNDSFVLCHAHYRNRDAYDEGHIPGAIQLDTNWLESPETWNRRSPHELKEAFERLGIRHDTTVVLYGRFSHPDNDDPYPGSSAGHLGAIRCAFIMLYAGVEDVRVLNGGLQSWLDEGYETVTTETYPSPAGDFGTSIPARPGLAVDLPEAKDILASGDGNLVSIRSWSEYIGKVSGYNYIEKRGRIPGSVFGNCGSDAYHMENYRNLDHTMREYHEIESLWVQAGITSDKHNAFYCGTGWRGSEAFFAAWLMGWPRVSVFDGGWFEWSNDDDNPRAMGDPDDAVMIRKGVIVK